VRWHLRRVYKHGFWMLLAVAGQLAVRAVVPPALLKGATAIAGNFLQTFGGMYGVIVAFAIYVVWQEHNETQVTIEREATALAELFRVLAFMRSWPARERALSLLLEYATIVPRANSHELSCETEAERELLDAALNEYLAYSPCGTNEERLYESGLTLFRNVTDAREHRQTVANLRLPLALKWFVFIGGALAVAAMWMAWIKSEAIQALLTASMTWVVVASSSIILDLDNPYAGDFTVRWGRFEEVRQRMQQMRADAGMRKEAAALQPS
jgi:hypothetical protein